MTLYSRMATPFGSAARRASASVLTLKAMIIAFEATARLTSLTLTLPRPAWMTLARVSVWSPSFSSELTIGSTLPWTSALTIRFSSLIAPERMRAKTASSVHLAITVALASAVGGLDHRARGALVGDRPEAIASGGHAGQPEDFDRETTAAPL